MVADSAGGSETVADDVLGVETASFERLSMNMGGFSTFLSLLVRLGVVGCVLKAEVVIEGSSDCNVV